MRDEMEEEEGSRGMGGGLLEGHAQRAPGGTRGRMLWFIQPRSGGDVDKVCLALSTSPDVIYSSAGRRLCPRGEAFEKGREQFA